MPQWFRRLTAPVTSTSVVRFGTTVPPALVNTCLQTNEIVHGQERKVRKEVIVDGASYTETITIQPMTADELKRELAAWHTETRESQWRRLR